MAAPPCCCPALPFTQCSDVVGALSITPEVSQIVSLIEGGLQVTDEPLPANWRSVPSPVSVGVRLQNVCAGGKACQATGQPGLGSPPASPLSKH